MVSLVRHIIREVVAVLGAAVDDDQDLHSLPRGAAQILSSIDRHYGELPEPVVWATALVLIALSRGGTCLPLDRVASLPEAEKLPSELRRLSAEEWLEHLAPITHRDTGDIEPLCVRHDSLYFDRYFAMESEIAQRLCAPLPSDAAAMPARFVAAAEEIFATSESENLPLAAALGVWSHRCYVLAGGPGTGKTTTIARFLAALEASLVGEDSFPRVRLCAPTGKAAQRMGEAIAAAVRVIDLPEETKTQLLNRVQPTTIHSLLGITPVQPRRRHDDYIPADIVICDETSMVDVALMNELVRALSPTTRIVLVGDPNQLQSVDAGSAMGDIVDAMRHGHIAGTELTVVRRVSGTNRDVLLQLFEAVRHGDADAAISLLSNSTSGVTWIPLNAERPDVPDEVMAQVLARSRELRAVASNDDASPEDVRRLLTSVMVLVAQHQGPLGRNWWVRRVADAENINVSGAPRTIGTPVLITQSDRGAKLVNGDDGVVRQSATGPVFDSGGSLPVRLRPAAITHWQPWYAMTIHKSQGSEFQRVIVSVTPGTRLLSRELLYTALTRAKEEVTVIATPDDLRWAIERPVARLTGLSAALAMARRSHPL